MRREMMVACGGLLAMVSYVSAAPMKWTAFVERVAEIESGRKAGAVGDRGAARGAWQMHRGAWADVSRNRERCGRPVAPYTMAHDLAVAREYASDYLAMLAGRLAAHYRRSPALGEIYAAYNLGWEGFKKRGFELGRCPVVTRRAVGKLTAENAKNAKRERD